MMDINLKERVARSLGKIPSGIGVLTAQYKKEMQAMVCSWFQQASFDPPLITVAIKNDRSIAELIRSAQSFAVNLLGVGQKKLLVHFGRLSNKVNDPFQGIEVQLQKNGPPILKEALSFLQCELKGIYPAGDHQLYIGEVIEAGVNHKEELPMTHLRKSGFSY